MRSLESLKEKLKTYKEAEFIYDPSLGYIAWHYSTGDNIEVLYIEANVVGIGAGGTLYQRMIETLLERGEKSYHSVFGYRLASNETARKFYHKLGWTQVNLGQSIYAGDDTVVMWITWEKLLERLHFLQE